MVFKVSAIVKNVIQLFPLFRSKNQLAYLNRSYPLRETPRPYDPTVDIEEKLYLTKEKSDVGILMLHGFSSTTDCWNDWPEELHKLGYSVSAPLLPGHGLTDFKNTFKYNHKDWLDGVQRSYNELSKNSHKVVVIGHSLGAALSILLSHRVKPEGLMLVTPALHPSFFMSFLERLDFLVKKFPGITFPAVVSGDIESPSGSELCYSILSGHMLSCLQSAMREAVLTLPELSPDIDVSFVIGEKDRLLSSEKLTKDFDKLRVKNKKLITYPNSGHVITKDNAALELFKEILDLIERV